MGDGDGLPIRKCSKCNNLFSYLSSHFNGNCPGFIPLIQPMFIPLFPALKTVLPILVTAIPHLPTILVQKIVAILPQVVVEVIVVVTNTVIVLAVQQLFLEDKLTVMPI